MKISYVMIVLNGMPFIKPTIESIYESAHEIIIVEGAEEKGMFAANPDGSSKDGTVEFIKTFPDPDKKIKLIQGKWFDKCEMQNRAVKIVSGDYVWLVDSDEVYKKNDIKTVIRMLSKDTSIYQVNMPCIHFWKGYDWILDSNIDVRQKASRIFKMETRCKFSTHRPPTMQYRRPRRKSNRLKVVNALVLMERDIRFYHYSYVLEKQVWQKMNLYKIYGWEKPWKMDLLDWYHNCFIKWTPKNKQEIEAKYTIIPCAPKSKTKPFTGTHPESMKTFVEGVK